MQNPMLPYSGINIKLFFITLTLSIFSFSSFAEYNENELMVIKYFESCEADIKWKTSSYRDYEIAGVYNFKTQEIEWKTSSYSDYAIAGVYNFKTQEVEWKTSSYSD